MKLSVVIPTHNRHEILKEALARLSATHFPKDEFEVIVVDDGSTDNTEEALKPYLGRIRYIKQQNQGRAAARNTGISEAKGELIAFNDPLFRIRKHSVHLSGDSEKRTFFNIKAIYYLLRLVRWA